MNVRLIVSVAIVAGIISGCGRGRATSMTSPDGSLVAVPDRSGEVVITIKSKSGAVVHHWKTGASSHQNWSLVWKDNKTLVFDSVDIGAYVLEQQADGTWRESTRGGVFSPDGRMIVQTSWQSAESKKLKIWFGDVTGHRSYNIRGDFTTNLVVADPFNCARWDGNRRVIVNATDGEHGWQMQDDGMWREEK